MTEFIPKKTMTVCIRICPNEKKAEETFKLLNTNQISLDFATSTSKIRTSEIKTKRTYTFDRCFHASTTQSEIFLAIGQPTVLTFLGGPMNSSIIAYGQTGSGKTHTMFGSEDATGLIPRILELFFSEKSKQEKIEISFFEIYNERVSDLLRCPKLTESEPKPKLRVREHPHLGPFVQGLHWIDLSDTSSRQISELGRRVRATGINRDHHSSSRSHAIVSVRRRLSSDQMYHHMHMVDLAGSERLICSSSRSQMRESAHINKSLAALRNVILNLSHSSRKNFVPYRDSILTWILRDSLNGIGPTVLIGTVSPDSDCYWETKSTLQYAYKARTILNNRISTFPYACRRPLTNRNQYQLLIDQLQDEIVKLQLKLAQTSSQRDFRCTNCSNNELDSKLRDNEEELSSSRSSETQTHRTNDSGVHECLLESYDSQSSTKFAQAEIKTREGDFEGDTLVTLSNKLDQLQCQLNLLTNQGVMDDVTQRNIDSVERHDRSGESSNRSSDHNQILNNANDLPTIAIEMTFDPQLSLLDEEEKEWMKDMMEEKAREEGKLTSFQHNKINTGGQRFTVSMPGNDLKKSLNSSKRQPISKFVTESSNSNTPKFAFLRRQSKKRKIKVDGGDKMAQTHSEGTMNTRVKGQSLMADDSENIPQQLSKSCTFITIERQLSSNKSKDHPSISQRLLPRSERPSFKFLQKKEGFVAPIKEEENTQHSLEPSTSKKILSKSYSGPSFLTNFDRKVNLNKSLPLKKSSSSKSMMPKDVIFSRLSSSAFSEERPRFAFLRKYSNSLENDSKFDKKLKTEQINIDNKNNKMEAHKNLLLKKDSSFDTSTPVNSGRSHEAAGPPPDTNNRVRLDQLDSSNTTLYNSSYSPLMQSYDRGSGLTVALPMTSAAMNQSLPQMEFAAQSTPTKTKQQIRCRAEQRREKTKLSEESSSDSSTTSSSSSLSAELPDTIQTVGETVPLPQIQTGWLNRSFLGKSMDEIDQAKLLGAHSSKENDDELEEPHVSSPETSYNAESFEASSEEHEEKECSQKEDINNEALGVNRQRRDSTFLATSLNGVLPLDPEDMVPEEIDFPSESNSSSIQDSPHAVFMRSAAVPLEIAPIMEDIRDMDSGPEIHSLYFTISGLGDQSSDRSLPISERKHRRKRSFSIDSSTPEESPNSDIETFFGRNYEETTPIDNSNQPFTPTIKDYAIISAPIIQEDSFDDSLSEGKISPKIEFHKSKSPGLSYFDSEGELISGKSGEDPADAIPDVSADSISESTSKPGNFGDSDVFDNSKIDISQTESCDNFAMSNDSQVDHFDSESRGMKAKHILMGRNSDSTPLSFEINDEKPQRYETYFYMEREDIHFDDLKDIPDSIHSPQKGTATETTENNKNSNSRTLSYAVAKTLEFDEIDSQNKKGDNFTTSNDSLVAGTAEYEIPNPELETLKVTESDSELNPSSVIVDYISSPSREAKLVHVFDGTFREEGDADEEIHEREQRNSRSLPQENVQWEGFPPPNVLPGVEFDPYASLYDEPFLESISEHSETEYTPNPTPTDDTRIFDYDDSGSKTEEGDGSSPETIIRNFAYADVHVESAKSSSKDAVVAVLRTDTVRKIDTVYTVEEITTTIVKSPKSPPERVDRIDRAKILPSIEDIDEIIDSEPKPNLGPRRHSWLEDIQTDLGQNNKKPEVQVIIKIEDDDKPMNRQDSTESEDRMIGLIQDIHLSPRDHTEIEIPEADFEPELGYAVDKEIEIDEHDSPISTHLGAHSIDPLVLGPSPTQLSEGAEPSVLITNPDRESEREKDFEPTRGPGLPLIPGNPALDKLYGMLHHVEETTSEFSEKTDDDVLNVSMVDGVHVVTMEPRVPKSKRADYIKPLTDFPPYVRPRNHQSQFDEEDDSSYGELREDHVDLEQQLDDDLIHHNPTYLSKSFDYDHPIMKLKSRYEQIYDSDGKINKSVSIDDFSESSKREIDDSYKMPDTAIRTAFSMPDLVKDDVINNDVTPINIPENEHISQTVINSGRRLSDGSQYEYKRGLIMDSVSLHPSNKAVSWSDISAGQPLELSDPGGHSRNGNQSSPLKPIIKRKQTAPSIPPRPHSYSRSHRNVLVEYRPGLTVFRDAETQTYVDPGDSTFRSSARSRDENSSYYSLGTVDDLYKEEQILEKRMESVSPTPSNVSMGTLKRYRTRRLYDDLFTLVEERDRVKGTLTKAFLASAAAQKPNCGISPSSKYCVDSFKEKVCNSRLELDSRIQQIWTKLKDSDLKGLTYEEKAWILRVINSDDLTLRSPHAWRIDLANTEAMYNDHFKQVNHDSIMHSPDNSLNGVQRAVDYQRHLLELRRAMIFAHRNMSDNMVSPRDNRGKVNSLLDGFYTSDYMDPHKKRDFTNNWVKTNGETSRMENKISAEIDRLRHDFELGSGSNSVSNPLNRQIDEEIALMRSNLDNRRDNTSDIRQEVIDREMQKLRDSVDNERPNQSSTPCAKTTKIIVHLTQKTDENLSKTEFIPYDPDDGTNFEINRNQLSNINTTPKRVQFDNDVGHRVISDSRPVVVNYDDSPRRNPLPRPTLDHSVPELPIDERVHHINDRPPLPNNSNRPGTSDQRRPLTFNEPHAEYPDLGGLNNDQPYRDSPRETETKAPSTSSNNPTGHGYSNLNNDDRLPGQPYQESPREINNARGGRPAHLVREHAGYVGQISFPRRNLPSNGDLGSHQLEPYQPSPRVSHVESIHENGPNPTEKSFKTDYHERLPHEPYQTSPRLSGLGAISPLVDRRKTHYNPERVITHDLGGINQQLQSEPFRPSPRVSDPWVLHDVTTISRRISNFDPTDDIYDGLLPHQPYQHSPRY